MHFPPCHCPTAKSIRCPPLCIQIDDVVISTHNGTHGHYTGKIINAYDDVDGELWVPCFSNTLVDSSFSQPHAMEYGIDEVDAYWITGPRPNDDYVFKYSGFPGRGDAPIGEHEVVCVVIDRSGNIAQESYTIIVEYNPIPSWVKKLVRSGCSTGTEDKQLLDALVYLVENDVIKANVTPSSGETSQKLPSWTKITICFWANDRDIK